MIQSCTPPQRSSGNCKPKVGHACGESDFDLQPSFKAIVKHYRKVVAPREDQDRRFYGNPDQTLESCIQKACLSVNAKGQMHSHQWLIGHAKLALAVPIFLANKTKILEAENFAQLHSAVQSIVNEIVGLGELAAYDIAERIGWYKNIEPEEIYLHAGTREGARLFEPKWRGKTMPANLELLPAAFHDLTAAELESVLCIYKRSIERLVANLRKEK